MKHGQRPFSRFTGAGRDHDLIRWLLSFGSGYPVHLHGPDAWRLEERIGAAGFPVQREEQARLRVTVSCLRHCYDARAIQLYGPVECRSAPATEAGRRDLTSWLRMLGAVPEVVLADPYGGSAELEAGLREQGWPVRVEKLNGAWAVSIFCDPGRYLAYARQSPVTQRTTAPATAGGRQALLTWMAELGPVSRVIVYNADQDSVDLAAALTDAQFPAARVTHGTLAAPPGGTFGGVQIQLALRGLGWLEMHLRVNADSVRLRGSTALTDTWKRTLTALTGLLRGAAETQAVWLEESGSHRLVFSVRDHGVLWVAKSADGSQVHLLAALAGEQEVVVAQAEVGAKTNEIPMIIPLLDGLDLAGTVITADALHCQRATAGYLNQRGADFILPVKDNQPGLFDALDALPWHNVPVAHTATDRGHGRITTRTIQVMDAPADLPFPHVDQAYLIERRVTDLHGKNVSDVAALGVTSLTADRVGPALLASLVRSQWAIESLHWLRDTLYRGDDSTVRTRSGPRVMASLRNLAIGALRLAGRHDTTEASRWASRCMNRPFAILGLT